MLTRGSQYRVESMVSRLAHTQNYILASPSKEQVARQVSEPVGGGRWVPEGEGGSGAPVVGRGWGVGGGDLGGGG